MMTTVFMVLKIRCSLYKLLQYISILSWEQYIFRMNLKLRELHQFLILVIKMKKVMTDQYNFFHAFRKYWKK